MAAKCNITGLALDALSKLQWGFNCRDKSCAIIENYIEYLACPNIDLIICNQENTECGNSITTVFSCNFNLISISATLNPTDDPESDVIFDLKLVDYVGGKLPFSYVWTYDTDDFDIIGENNLPQIKLKVKPDKQVELLVTQISVQITDADGCIDTKSCWLTPEGMECNINYVACSSPVDLEVISIYNECSKPKSLEVIAL